MKIVAGRKPIVTDDPTDNPFQWLHYRFASPTGRKIQSDVSEGINERFSFFAQGLIGGLLWKDF